MGGGWEGGILGEIEGEVNNKYAPGRRREYKEEEKTILYKLQLLE